MKKIEWAVISIFLLGAINLFSAYPQDTQQSLSVEGYISDIDWAGSTVTVKWLETDGEVQYDEITIFVPDSSRITKDGASIGLANLQPGDHVNAQYINTSPGPLRLITMAVSFSETP